MLVPDADRWWKVQRLRLKYRMMQREGVIYPDVYCLALYFGNRFNFVKNGRKIHAGECDLVLSELHESRRQLDYLESLVRQGAPPVAVIPGPPEILFCNPTRERLDSVKRILSMAAHVWAYSEHIAKFCNQLIGQERAVVIPWPFHFSSVARCNPGQPRSSSHKRVLFQVPLRFCGVTQNFPFLLKAILKDVWSQLPRDARESMSLHTFLYTREDRSQCRSSGFLDGLPIKVEPKMGYTSFLAFLGACDAVVNFSAGSILGRITFLSAALGRPGIFSSNSELNRQLYPWSTADLDDTDRVRHLLQKLLLAVAGLEPHSFLPAIETAAAVGNFEQNALRMQALLKGNPLCVASQAC